MTRCLWAGDLVMRWLWGCRFGYEMFMSRWLCDKMIMRVWFGDEVFISRLFGHEMFMSEWFGHEMFRSESALAKRCLWLKVIWPRYDHERLLWPCDVYEWEWNGQDMFMSECFDHDMFMCASNMAKICSWASTLVLRCLCICASDMAKIFSWMSTLVMRCL